MMNTNYLNKIIITKLIMLKVLLTKGLLFPDKNHRRHYLDLVSNLFLTRHKKARYISFPMKTDIWMVIQRVINCGIQRKISL